MSTALATYTDVAPTSRVATVGTGNPLQGRASGKETLISLRSSDTTLTLSPAEIGRLTQLQYQLPITKLPLLQISRSRLHYFPKQLLMLLWAYFQGE